MNYEDHRKRGQVLVSERDRAQTSLNEHKSARAPKLHQAQESEHRLKRLRESKEQRGGYPNGMDALLSAIQREKNFVEQPLGPIGDFVHLKKAVWSGILEKSFGATLNGFIVTSKDDQKRLSSIMRKSNCSVPIFIGNSSIFDYSDHEPEAQFETILRVLKVDHPSVLRQLIINHNIEQIILIENLNDASGVMFGQPRICNVKACLSLHPSDRSVGERIAYGTDNSVSTNFMEIYRGLPRMKTDSQNQINLENEVLDQARSKLNDHDTRQQELMRTLESCRQALKDHKETSDDLKIAYQQAEDKVDQLRDELDKNVVEEGKLEALKQGLEKQEEDKKHFGQSYQESVLAKDEHLAKKKVLLNDLNKIDERLAIITKKVDKAQKAREKAEERRLNALIKKNEAFQEIETLREDRTEQEQERASQSEKVKDFTVKAKQIGDRVAVAQGETTDSLEKKLHKLDADQKRFEQRIGGDVQKISNDYTAAATAHKVAAKQIEDDERLVQVCQIMLPLYKAFC